LIPDTRPEHNWIHPSRAQKTAEKVLTIFDETCTNLNIPYFLRAGTCLGFYREGKHIEWAGDIDVGVICVEIQELWEELKKRGFWVGFGKAVAVRRVLVDIGYVFNEYKLKYLKSFDTVTYKEKEYNVPHPVEEYLEYRYGSNWTIPRAGSNSKIGPNQRIPIRRFLSCLPVTD